MKQCAILILVIYVVRMKPVTNGLNQKDKFEILKFLFEDGDTNKHTIKNNINISLPLSVTNLQHHGGIINTPIKGL